MKYASIIKAVASTPWAILPEKLEAIMEFLELKAAGVDLSPAEVQAKMGNRKRESIFQQIGSVAVIPVHGVISHRMNMMQQISGGTSTQLLKKQLLGAVDDKSVDSILLDIDSPGGAVSGVPEIGADIRVIREIKPVIASVNSLGASAGYWIASQASEVVVTPSGQVGSIGVFAAHMDRSKAYEKLGVTPTLISAGKHKTEANPFEPLSKSAKAHLQERVDELHGMFLEAVADGRGIPVKTVEKNFGDGRLYGAKKALEFGMVDRIQAHDQVLARELLTNELARKQENISTIRDFELFLRDAGFSRKEAAQVASHGFPARDQGEPASAPIATQELVLGLANRYLK